MRPGTPDIAPGSMSPPAASASAPSADWMQLLFDAIDDAVFVHDAEGNILEANSAACRRLGYTRAEMLRLSTKDIDDPSFAAGFADRLKTQLGEGRFRCQGRHRTKDGRVIPVDINTSAIQLNGKPAVLAVMRDISQQKQAEEALARQTELLRSVLNTMGEAVLVANTAQKLLGFNPTAQKLFALGPESQEIGRPLQPRGLFKPDRITPLSPDEAPLTRCLRGEEINDMEMFVRRPHAPAGLWVSVSGRPIRDAAGNLKGAVIVCHDFTERKRAADRLAAQYAVARTLTEGDGLREGASKILEGVCEVFGLDVGVLWLVDGRENCLYCHDCWHRTALNIADFLEVTRQIALDSGRDVPGKAWAEGAPASLEFADDAELTLRAQLARAGGLRASFAVPIAGNGKTSGVIEFLSRGEIALEDDLLSMLTACTNQIGQVLERRRMEAALRDSEAFYQSLVNHLPQNIFRKDLQGRITFANRRFCECVRLSPEELLGKTDFDLFPTELAAKYVADDRRVIETGEPFETVEAHRLPDGTRLHVQVVKTPVYDSKGRIAGVQGIFWDVTERMHAEGRLSESESRYRQLAEATLDGIVLADEASRIRLFNPAAEQLFGYKAEEVIGKPTAMLVPPELRGRHQRGFERYLATREAHLIGKKVEVPALRKDGSTVQVEIALSALPNGEPSEGELHPPVLFLAAIRDLSERNRMRSIVLQSEKLASIGLLSAGIAHEINNPLSFVANNLAVLERDTLGLLRLLGLYKEAGKLAPELTRKIAAQEDEIDLPYLQTNLAGILQRTRDGVERVSRIIHSLRGLARTEAPEPRENVSLVDLIDNSLEILHGRFKRSGIRVEQEHDPNPRLTCVETQIGQVLLNLLLNAFQAVESHRKQGGLVRIRTQRCGGEMMIEVKDNGPGIPLECQDRLFDPFFTTKEPGEGTGLGLAITHHIVQGHGGHIDVDSAPGHGAVFRVYLPLQKPKT